MLAVYLLQTAIPSVFSNILTLNMFLYICLYRILYGVSHNNDKIHII